MVRNSKVTDTSQRVNHNRMIVRRILSVLLSVLILMPAFGGIRVYAEEPTRQINLVYDDSGSMIYTDHNYVDTWCQAKYALEVFAGMLGERDKLDVYYMSDFKDTDKAEPRLRLDGKNGAQKNVSEVHNTVTSDWNTPLASVKHALNKLVSTKADEKWLVILTDGAFEDDPASIDELSKYLEDPDKKPADVKVMYLGMGAKAGALPEDKGRDIHSMKAKESKDILAKLTTIGTQVFNKAELPGSGTNISFDVPMKQLVVFAQGENVKINGIKSESGQSYNCSPVDVRYSEKATTRGPNANNRESEEIKKTIKTDLCGSMATFNDSFPEGKYTIDVKGADTIDIYYQPDVDIIAKLSRDGEELTDFSKLQAGEYTVNFDIVKAGTEESVSGSKLLGDDLKYDATVINNGKEQHDIHNGDKITVEEGDLSIDATATYLKYYTVHTSLTSDIFKDKEVAFTKTGNKVHHLTKAGFTKEDDEATPDNEPTQIAATLDGKEPTSEQWAMMDVPSVSGGDKKLNYRIEKSDTPGIYNVYPELKEEKPVGSEYETGNINLSYEGTAGEEKWAGNGEVEISISDDRCWACKHIKWLIILIILATITAILLGYVPGIKHYLPRKLKKRPMITSKKIGSYERPPKPTNGQLEKSLASTLIPYVAERGTIRYVPKGIAGAPKLQVKGSKKGRMEITNIRDFSKKKNISFDGERGDRLIEDMGNKKKFTASAGLTMTSEINGVKYTCSLNE